MIDKQIENMLRQREYIENQKRNNIFDRGISRAVASSNPISSEQENTALRKSLLAFGQDIGQQPRKAGLFKNFVSVGKSLSPAIQAYDQSNEESKKQNIQAAAVEKKAQEYMQNKIAQDEATAYTRVYQKESRDLQQQNQNQIREYQNRVLEQSDRHHQQNLENKINLQNQKNLQPKKNGFIPNTNVDELGLVKGKYAPFISSKDRDAYTKGLVNANSAISSIDEAKDVINKLTPEGEKPGLNASPYFGSEVGTFQRLIGGIFNDEEMKAKGMRRQDVDQVVGVLSKFYERLVKGGILTSSIIKIFQKENLVPLLGDTPEQMLAKLNNMMKSADIAKNIATKSLTTNTFHDGKDEEIGQTKQIEQDEYTFSIEELNEALAKKGQ